MKLNRTHVTLLLIAFVLLMMELVIRVSGSYLSGNIRHISEIPDIVEASQGKNAVFFIGNSLTANAVDLSVLETSALDYDDYIILVPDGTSMWDWYCVFKNEVAAAGKQPAVVVSGYAWQQVPPVPSRLGGFFCQFSDLPALMSMGMDSTSEVIEFVLAKISRTYAMRETLRKRLLDLIIPHYREQTRIVNDEARKNKKLVTRHLSDSAPDYRLLTSYINLVKDNGSQAVIILMPVVEYYKVEETFINTVEQEGALLLDYRLIPGIDKKSFRDPIHLNQQGRPVFSQHLLKDLKGI